MTHNAPAEIEPSPPNQPAHEHVHGHGHGHDEHDRSPVRAGSVWRRARHWLSEQVGGHSHSISNQLDAELEANREGRRALFISLGVLGVTFALQAIVTALSGSVALLGDTLHNLTDARTAVPLLVAYRLGVRAPTRRYTYGYDRAEDIAGIFVVAMIALSAAVVDVEHVVAVDALGIRWIGHTLRAEVDLTVTSDLTLLEAHEIAHHAEAHLLARVPRLTAATVHTSPQGVH